MYMHTKVCARQGSSLNTQPASMTHTRLCHLSYCLSAGNDFEYTNSAFGQNFTQVEFLRETKPKDFLLAVKVKAGAAGKDIATNGLQDIAGLYITAITRTATQQTFQDFGPNFELEVSLFELLG